MPAHQFAPGFRPLSWLDIGILITATVIAVLLIGIAWWTSAIIAWVVSHFFLFCNVFRLARPLELTWGGIFVALAASTMMLEIPGWAATFALSLLSTIVVVFVEMRKPSYHGIGWQLLNPKLRSWWDSHLGERGV